MSRSNAKTTDTINIDSSGNTVALELHGRSLVSMHITGDDTAEYQWDARIIGGTWQQDVSTEYTGQSDYDDILETGAEEIRVRCSNGTGGTDDEATIILMAGG